MCDTKVIVTDDVTNAPVSGAVVRYNTWNGVQNGQTGTDGTLDLGSLRVGNNYDITLNKQYYVVEVPKTITISESCQSPIPLTMKHKGKFYYY